MIFPRRVDDLPIEIRKYFKFSYSSAQPVSGITVVIPIRGTDRQENLNYCISRLLLQNVKPMEIIVSEEDDSEKINIDKFKNDNRIKKIFTTNPTKPFNKSIAVNAGVSVASHAKIVMNDADIVPPKGYLQRIDKVLNSYDFCFFGKEIYNVYLVRKSVIWKGKKRVDYFSGGSIAFTKKAFFEIGGMCEKFYVSKDCEFWERANRLIKFHESRDSIFLYLNHKRENNFSQNTELYDRLMGMYIEERLVSLKNNLEKEIMEHNYV